nr:G-type lectin S-receptor-like serine/threonine-protein kinase At1g61550 [Tanacetum cinerariifolium]
HSIGTDILTKDSPISLGQTLVSANEVFELGFFNPGNSTNRYIGIWYKNIIARKVIWVANRKIPLLVSDTNSTLIIDNDGNLRILDGEHNSVWSTKVRVQFNETIAKLTDVGNFCLNDTTSGSILWASFDYPGNSLLPGMKLGTNGKTQFKHVMTSWISDDDPAPEEFVAGLSAEQPPQALVWRGSKPYYRGGPWDGGKFIGFFSPDNSAKQYLGIWFKNITIRKIIWVANRESPLSISDTSSSLTIVDDGNLRILDGERNTVWSTNITLQSNKTTAKLTNTGDFCLNDTISGIILWESFDYPSNSLLPGMKLGTNGKTQGTHFMTSWKSDDDPTPGNFVVGLSEEWPPQIFTWNGSKPHRRGGPWDGGKVIGVPEQDPGYSELINLGPENSRGGGYLTLHLLGSSDFRWLYLQPDGYLPESNEEWGRSNWTRGCVRRSELLCEKNESSLCWDL